MWLLMDIMLRMLLTPYTHLMLTSVSQVFLPLASCLLCRENLIQNIVKINILLVEYILAHKN